MRKLLPAFLLIAAPAAASLNNVGGSSGEFLEIGGGARSLGMGEAYTAVADGPDALYWNPAGLTSMSRPEATYARTELPAGLHHDFLAAGVPVPLLRGTLAVGVTRLTQDSLAQVNSLNQSQGSFSPHSEAYAFAYGLRMIDSAPPGARSQALESGHEWIEEASAGVSGKLIEENLGTRTASAWAVDAGGSLRPADLHELILAGAVRNLGSKLKFISESEPLPEELAASAAWEAKAEDWRFLPAVEVDFPRAGNVYEKFGFEASKTISSGMSAAARVGYTSVSAADLGFVSGITAGVGLKAGRFSFDAAFQPLAALGQTFRLGVGWTF